MNQQLFKKKKRNADEAPDPTQGSEEAPVRDDLQARIAQRAYELYEQGGCCDGHNLDHWLQAEREIMSGEL